HASNATAAVAPNASGALNGVKGINQAGAVINTVSHEFEICFRCHADSTARGAARINRQYVQTNLRLAFSGGNQSVHPVVSNGRNPLVPSLVAPYSTSSQIYCTDCHNSDQSPGANGSGPNGPH